MQDSIANTNILFDTFSRMHDGKDDLALTGIRCSFETESFSAAALVLGMYELKPDMVANFFGSRLEMIVSPTAMPTAPPTVLVQDLLNSTPLDQGIGKRTEGTGKHSKQ